MVFLRLLAVVLFARVRFLVDLCFLDPTFFSSLSLSLSLTPRSPSLLLPGL